MHDSQLPDAELEVMASLWRLKQATARQIREQLLPFRPLAHGSVCTLLQRLQAKGLVSRERGPVGKAFIYQPTARSDRTSRQMLRDLVKRIFGGSGVALVASLFETQPPTGEELNELERLLAELRQSSSASKP